MKTKMILFAVLTLCLMGVVGCEGKDDDYSKNLIGTWKLQGFGDASGNSFRFAEPKDCESCFVITFRNNGTFTGKSTINSLGSDYKISGNLLSFPNGVLTTKVDEITGDGATFTSALMQVKKYNVEGSKLYLYYTDKKYLLFILLH